MSASNPETRALMRAAKTLSASAKHLRAGGMHSFAVRVEDLLAGVRTRLAANKRDLRK